MRPLSARSCAPLQRHGRSRNQEARSYATLEIQVAHEDNGYVERACGVEFDWTRHGVVCGAEHLANF